MTAPSALAAAPPPAAVVVAAPAAEPGAGVLALAHRAAAAVSMRPARAPVHRAVRPARQPAASPAAVPPRPVRRAVYSFAGLEALWRAERGPVWSEATAACIAEHESRGEARAVNHEPTQTDYGLWQEANRPDALDPVVSARVAVAMSHGGTDWSHWGTASMCGA